MEKNRENTEQEKTQEENTDLIEMKLLTPLAGEFFPDEEGWEDGESYEDGGEPLDGGELAQYEDAIQKAVDRENAFGEEDGKACNLMDYFYGSPSIKEKVGEAVVSVENVDGILYGCATLQLKEFLESEELHELCEYITGQYSDGWGEGFEQRDIRIDGGTLNVHFWQGEPTRFQALTTEKKRMAPEPGKAFPEPKKPRPKMRLVGHEGNIFSVLSDAVQLLSRNGMGKEADEMTERVFNADGYYKALSIISEYVETEMSDVQEKKNPKKQKTGKEPCR